MLQQPTSALTKIYEYLFLQSADYSQENYAVQILL